jgi:hypothetical protein
MQRMVHAHIRRPSRRGKRTKHEHIKHPIQADTSYVPFPDRRTAYVRQGASGDSVLRLEKKRLG